MSKETIEKIASRVKETSSLSGNQKNEMLRLLDDLKSEIGELAKTDKGRAEKIANLTESSTEEAIKKEKEPELAELTSTVENFEASHPALVRIVNRIIVMLSDIGI